MFNLPIALLLVAYLKTQIVDFIMNEFPKAKMTKRQEVDKHLIKFNVN